MAKRNLKPRKRPEEYFGTNAHTEIEPEEQTTSVHKQAVAKVTKAATAGSKNGSKAKAEKEPKAEKTVLRVKDEVLENGTVVRDLEPGRKLNKKQTDQLSNWFKQNKGRPVDPYFRSQLASARKQFGHMAVMMGDELDSLMVGIPCPLVWQFVIQQSVFPLGLVFMLVGPPGTHKSALLAEIMRWFAEANGGGVLAENETKISPDWWSSIMRFEPQDCPLIVNRCGSVEGWQEVLSWWVPKQKKDLTGTKEEPGPGRTIPICFGVDSVMGKTAMENQEKIAEAGFAGKNYAIEAGSISKYMGTIPQWLDGWPFSLVLINHLLPGIGDVERRKSGGRKLDFQESFEIETSITKSKIQTANFDGAQIRLSCFKNSFGVTHRSAQTRILWWEEDHPETGQQIQRTVWDWDWATIKLLTTLQGRPAAKMKDLGVHFDAPKSSDVENLVWSRSLGIPKKEPVPWNEAGAMLMQNPEVLALVQRALSIKMRPLLKGNYLKQLNELRKTMR